MRRLPAILALIVTIQSAHAESATWKTNPSTADWNTDINWTPPTVPNGPSDVATFATSNTTAVSLSDDVEVSEIDFSAGASAYTFTLPPTTGSLTISGAGVVNNSGVTQHFITDADFNTFNSDITFTGSATAGSNTLFTALGGHAEAFPGGEIFFEDTSSADHATFEIFGNAVFRAHGGYVFFDVNSTAANATFFVYGASLGAGGNLTIAGTAGSAHIINYEGGGSSYGETNFSGRGGTCRIVNRTGRTSFRFSADAEQAIILNEGGRLPGDFTFGDTFFSSGTPTGGDAIIVSEGGQGEGAAGGETTFLAGQFGNPTAGNATLIANAGVNGGEGGTIRFSEGGDGGTARFKLFGNGHLDLTQLSADAYSVTIGSLEGDGLVFLGINSLTIGSNNHNAAFAGVIQDAGSLAKVGIGTLTLGGASTYTGGTTVTAGSFRVTNQSGSATGAGRVEVTAGTLGGSGIIAGRVTIGDGSGTPAFLQPSVGVNNVTQLTLQRALTFKADGTYIYKLNTRNATADAVIANGVTIESGAQFSFQTLGNRRLSIGTIFTAINNTSANPIAGTFANLPDGLTFSAGRNTYQVSYNGGDGNDLTLTVMP